MIISKIKKKGQSYHEKKMLLSAVALLSPVSTLAVNSPVSAPKSIFLKAYSHSNGSWVQSNGCWWYKHSNGSYTRNGWEK